jgi:dihydroxyacetone kinase
MAAGAVCGNIFASPSAGQVVRVGSAVERGGGLLLAFGNYAGDVLHFSLGAERLRRQGIDVRIVTVTDDIASAGGELEPFWSAPADSPAYRRGSSITPPAGSQGGAQANPEPEVPSGSVNLTEPQRALLARFAAVEADLSQRVDELGALDAVAGDGDHGLGMLRGSQGAHAAVRSALARGCSTGEALMEAGEAWSDHGGGTSGALWGGGLLAAGQALAQAPGQNDPQQVVIAVGAALQAVRDLGQAALGDKTMLDALEPFQARLQGGRRRPCGGTGHRRTTAKAGPGQAPWRAQPRLPGSGCPIAGLLPEGRDPGPWPY